MIEVGTIKVWEALAMLCVARDGRSNVSSLEKKAKSILREIGMTNKEINSPYPGRGLHELFTLMENPKEFDKEVKRASQWMISRN